MWRFPFTALAAVFLVTAGCGASAEPPAPRASPTARATEARGSAEGRRTTKKTPSGRPSVERARCAPNAANCAAVIGRVLYVEAVDPDGDGDAHYVLVGGRVTAPGVSVIDVERALRPRRLPRAGDLVSAAGPVYKGSYGQSQIQAVELHYARR